MLSFGISVVFQGEAYEDPNPPEVDEAAAKKKGKKEAEEPEIRMITPEAVVMEKENGRLFEIELGRYEMVAPPTPSGGVSGEALADPNAPSSKMSKAEDVNASEEGAPEKVKQWIPFKLDHSNPDDNQLKISKATEKGVLTVEGLSFVLDEEKFPMAVYELVITDVTEGVDPDFHLPPTRVDLKVFDSTPIMVE